MVFFSFFFLANYALLIFLANLCTKNSKLCANSMYFARYEKKELISRFVKIFENYAPLSIFFFFGIMYLELNYVISHLHRKPWI